MIADAAPALSINARNAITKNTTRPVRRVAVSDGKPGDRHGGIRANVQNAAAVDAANRKTAHARTRDRETLADHQFAVDQRNRTRNTRRKDD